MTKISVFGEEPRKKELKKIELLGCLVDGCNVTNYACSEDLSSMKWAELTLISEDYGSMDVIRGVKEDDGEVYILFGHWNDGVL